MAFRPEILRHGIIKYVVFSAIVSSCFTCSPHQQFSVSLLYNSKSFSGADLGGRTITVSPLFTPRGIVVNGELTSNLEIQAINKKRRTLPLLPHELFEERYIATSGEDALDSFYTSLYKGEMVTLQTMEKPWKQIGSDYLMVLKLTYGLRVKSGEKKSARRLRLEGELWDCDSIEVLWRVAVDSHVRGEMNTDRQVLLDAICQVFEALPPVIPGYGKGRW